MSDGDRISSVNCKVSSNLGFMSHALFDCKFISHIRGGLGRICMQTM